MESKKGRILLGISLALLILGGLLYSYINFAETKKEHAELGAAAVATQKLPITEEIADSKYSIYRNHTYGYTFEYPTTWNIDFSDETNVIVSESDLESKTIEITLPYHDDVLGGLPFLEWAELQDWAFSPTLPSEYFNEVPVESGLLTYNRKDAEAIHTVIIPLNDNILYVGRVDGTGEGFLDGEDIYFHLLNSFAPIEG